MTRETTYRKEFHDTESNWNQNRLPASFLILGMVMIIVSAAFKPLEIIVVVGFGIVMALALHQRRLNKKRGLGIFDLNSKSNRNILGRRY